MRHYELVLVFSPTLNQEQTTASWTRVKEFIRNRNGEVTHEERWGTRRLAYPIHKGGQHFLEGAYYLTRFNTEQPFVRELESFLRVDEQVLRSLVVATGPPEPAVAPPEPVAVVAAAPTAPSAETLAEPVAAEATLPAETPAPAEEAAEAVVEPAATEGATPPRRRRRRTAEEVEPTSERVEPTPQVAPTQPRTRRRRTTEPVAAAPENAVPAEGFAKEGPTFDQPSA